MSCYHPNKIFYTGSLTETGKKEGIILFANDDTKIYPVDLAEKKLMHKINNDPRYVTTYPNGRRYLINYEEIPCQNCIGCRKEKALEWTNRILMEIKTNPLNNYFLTITYDAKNEKLSLSKRDIQLFLKRIREKQGELRYLVAGEYGERTFRPHYHMIMLNHYPGSGKKWDRQQTEMLELEKIWGKGRILGSDVTESNIAYTCQYTTKKAYSIEKNWPQNIEKPFILMSRRPGLGKDYIEENIDLIKKENLIFINGKHKLPRYAKKMIERDDIKRFEDLKKKGKEEGQQYEKQDYYLFKTDSKVDINEEKEVLAKAKLERKKRNKI